MERDRSDQLGSIRHQEIFEPLYKISLTGLYFPLDSVGSTPRLQLSQTRITQYFKMASPAKSQHSRVPKGTFGLKQ